MLQHTLHSTRHRAIACASVVYMQYNITGVAFSVRSVVGMCTMRLRHCELDSLVVTVGVNVESANVNVESAIV